MFTYADLLPLEVLAQGMPQTLKVLAQQYGLEDGNIFLIINEIQLDHPGNPTDFVHSPHSQQAKEFAEHAVNCLLCQIYVCLNEFHAERWFQMAGDQISIAMFRENFQEFKKHGLKLIADSGDTELIRVIDQLKEIFERP